MIELEYVTLFENQYKVLLPVCSRDVRPEIARLKYPSSWRPQIIKTNEDESIDFTYNLMTQDIPEEYLLTFLDMVSTRMKNQHAGVRFLKQHAEMGEQRNIVWTEYEMPTINGTAYYVMGLVKFNQLLLQAIYNCDALNKETWKKIMLRSINSIRSVIYE